MAWASRLPMASGSRPEMTAALTLALAVAYVATALAADEAALGRPLSVRPRTTGSQSLSLTMGIGSYYDDNILQYSDNQLADFDAGLHPYRYSVESTDDVVFNPGLGLGWELDQGRGRRHELRLRGEGDFHGKNGTANFRSASVSWRESWRRGRRLSLGYYRLDDYYVRQLYDEDLIPLVPVAQRYQRAQFDLQIGSLAWRQALTRRTRLELSYQYEYRRYAPEFQERTSGTQMGEAVLSWLRPPRHSSLTVTGGYRLSHAKAEDGDELPGVTPDDADVSYHGVVAGLGGRTRLAHGLSWRVDADLNYSLATRAYDSDRPADTYHYQRDDVLNAVDVGVRLGFFQHWSARGFYRFENNSASLGTAAPPTSDSGSYRINQVGVSLAWTGEVWKKSADQEQSEPDTEP
jgi:hypothetical protein